MPYTSSMGGHERAYALLDGERLPNRWRGWHIALPPREATMRRKWLVYVAGATAQTFHARSWFTARVFVPEPTPAMWRFVATATSELAPAFASNVAVFATFIPLAGMGHEPPCDGVRPWFRMLAAARMG